MRGVMVISWSSPLDRSFDDVKVDDSTLVPSCVVHTCMCARRHSRGEGLAAGAADALARGLETGRRHGKGARLLPRYRDEGHTGGSAARVLRVPAHDRAVYRALSCDVWGLGFKHQCVGVSLSPQHNISTARESTVTLENVASEDAREGAEGRAGERKGAQGGFVLSPWQAQRKWKCFRR
jgi:hypothetical protein